MLNLFMKLDKISNGIISNSNGSFVFDKKKIYNEVTLVELYKFLEGTRSIIVEGSSNVKEFMMLTHIEEFDVPHFKASYLMYRYIKLAEHLAPEFKKKIFNSLKKLYNYENSLEETIFYLLNLGELYSEEFSPVYYSLSHLKASMLREGKCQITYVPNFTSEFQDYLSFDDETPVFILDEEDIRIKLESFNSRLLEVFSLENKIDLYRVMGPMKLYLPETVTKTKDEDIEIIIQYLTPFKVFKELMCSFGKDFIITDLSGLVHII